MRRALLAVLLSAVSLSCCGDAEKLTVPPLPQDGTALPYAPVIARLSAQINTAKDEHFLNHWDAVVDASVALEHSAGYLVKAPDLTPAGRTRVEKAAAELTGNIVKLREAARKKDEAESLELIRRIHNAVRELQDLNK
jgi:hypothetical protein